MNPITHFLISWNISALSACPVRSEHNEGKELRQGFISNSVNTSNGVKMHQCLDTAAEKRDRILITLGGILPDIDGLGVIFELATRHTGRPLNFYSNYHHQLAHNISAAIVGLLAVLLLAKRKLFTALIFLMVFHIHLLCDLIGARGPEGYQWPIPYLSPFLSGMQLTWKYQWALNSWQNFVITIVMLGVVFIISCRKGFSPLELFSAKADKLFVKTLRRESL